MENFLIPSLLSQARAVAQELELQLLAERQQNMVCWQRNMKLERALRDLLAEVEYAIALKSLPQGWLLQDIDRAIANARALSPKATK